MKKKYNSYLCIEEFWGGIKKFIIENGINSLNIVNIITSFIMQRRVGLLSNNMSYLNVRVL